jgi:ankyrin repeat protein
MADDRNFRLSRAVYSGNVEGVKAELKAGADPNSTIMNVIQIGDRPGNKEIMRILLEAGADPNQIDQYGYPILGYALNSRSIGMCELLLKAGANPNVSFKIFGSVLEYGILVKSQREAQFPDKDFTDVCQATNYDEVERLKQVYPHFADRLNCQQSKATISNNMAVVETALDNAAIRTYPQQTPDGVELPHVMKNIKDYAYKNVGPGGRRRKTKKRKSGKKKTKKRK